MKYFVKSKVFVRLFSRGGRVEGQSPSSQSADCETPFASKSAGVGEKHFGGMLFDGKPRRGVPVNIEVFAKSGKRE